MSLSNARAETASGCDYCSQGKGRNSMMVHQLKFTDIDDLKKHLYMVFGSAGEKDGWIESRLIWWRFVHAHYGQSAKDKYAPLWLVYLEETGCTVKNRAQAIMNYRRDHGQATQ